MNEKLLLQDLVDLLSKKSKITKKDADSFFRELFQLILERIFDNDSVKIKDFGTFKLISISSRESVNVNTGEKIEIPPHYKLSFIPDKVLKNLVNKPFSQFETVLLEDGAVFDASIYNDDESVDEEGIVGNLEIDIEETDDDSIISDAEESIVVESASLIDNTDLPLTEEKSDTQIIPPKLHARSFVYTYTTSKTTEESGSITITVPKEDLSRSVLVSKDQIKSDQTYPEPLDETLISDELEPESDSNSEIEEKDESVIASPSPISIIDRLEKEEKVEVGSQDDFQIEKKRIFSNDDPERPLFPEEDDIITDVAFIPIRKNVEEEYSIDSNQVRDINGSIGDDKPAETESVQFSGAIDSFGNYDDNSSSLGIKFRKWWPVTFFIVCIVGVLSYGVIRMLNKPYDYEYNLGSANLSSSDTSFLKDDEALKIQIDGIAVDSQAIVPRELKEEVVINKPIEEKEVHDVKASSVVGNADSLTSNLIKAEESSFVISDKLKFETLNKAESHLAEKVQVKADVHSKPVYATVNKGTTLRTLATAHYGNPHYWVYIYEANRKKIRNPNNVSLGVSVLIPSLTDLGISDPKDPEAIQTAKNLGAKIVVPK